MNTSIRKSQTGWKASTSIEHNGQIISISTYKSNTQLATFVNVGRHENGFYCHIMFQDYSNRLLSEAVKATEKAVTNQHNRALALLDIIKSDVDKHYQCIPA